LIDPTKHAARIAAMVLPLVFAGCAGTGPSPEPVDPPRARPDLTLRQSPDVPATRPAAAAEPDDAATVVPPTTGPADEDVPVLVMERIDGEVEPVEAPPPAAQDPGAPARAAAGPPPPPGDLWERIRAGFAMPELNSPLVREKERFYLARPDDLERMLARGAPYLHFIVEELEKRGMPTELALLPFVESAMNPVAQSGAQAAGLWQFIPATGRRFELSQDWWIDERRDVVRSTRAALEYLQAIHEMHDRDWFLALASYNWGENAVARAVRHNRARGRPTGYLSLKMPTETRHYVPKLIALKRIVLKPGAHGVTLPPVPDAPYFASITKTQPIDLALAARFAGMSVEAFVALNPAHNRPVIAATRGNRIRLPVDRVDAFARAMARHVGSRKPLASWQPYTLGPGETLAGVARRAGVPLGELLRANDLRGDMRVLAGSRMLVPQSIVRDEMLVRSFTGPRVYQEVTVPATWYVARRGDTLAKVARRHRVSVASLRRWNGQRSTIQPGMRIVVRPAMTRTVLTTVSGQREVMPGAGAARPVAAPPGNAAAPRPAARPARRGARSGPAIETPPAQRRPAAVVRPRT